MLNNLLKNSLFSLLSNVIQLIVSLGSGMLIARNLGPTGKGEVFLITQTFNLVQVIFSFGFGPAIIYYLKKKEIAKSQINSFIICYCLFIAIVFIICLCFFNVQINHLLGSDVSMKILVFIALIAHLNIFASFIGYKHMSDDDGVQYWSVITLISNTFYILFIAVALLFYHIGVLGVVYGLVGGALMKILLLFAKPHVKSEGVNLITMAELRKLSTYGLQIFLSNLFLTTVFRIDTFLLNHMVNIAQLGVYSVSVNVAELLLLIPTALGVALFPHLSGLKRTEQQNAMCMIGRVSFIIGLVGIIGLLVIGYPFILVVFGRRFIPAFVPFLFLLPGLMAMTLNYSYSNYLSSIGKPLMGAYIFLVGLFINVVLNICLIPILGISGAAISSSITYTIITLGFVFYIRKIDKLKLSDFVFPKKSDLNYVKNKLILFKK